MSDLIDQIKAHINEHPIEHQSAFIGIGSGLVVSSFKPADKSIIFGLAAGIIAYYYLSNSSTSLNSLLPSSSSSSTTPDQSIVTSPQQQTCPSCPVFATVTKCAAPDGSTVATIKCPAGKTIKVTDVFYGRDSAITCQLSQGGYPDPTIFTPVASPPGALAAVKALCDGRNEASVPLNESTFGPDLNPKVLKYVRITYTCV